jgi:hypothetical protein
MEPKPIEDATLGRISWDQENEYWLGKLEVPRRDSIWLTICVGPADRPAVLRLTRQAVARLPELEPEARRFLADQLRKAEPSDPKRQRGDVDRAVEGMVLQSVIAEPDDVLQLVFGSEELFGGASVLVWFAADGDRGVMVLHERPPSGAGESA